MTQRGEPFRYVKLSGRSLLSLSYQRLYLGDDHLLAVDGAYTEEYRRFFFEDLGGVAIRKTQKGAWVNGILSVFVILGGLGLLADEFVLNVFGGVFGGGPLLALIINILKGPTSECRFKTAVQFERMTSLGRYWKAQRVIHEILPMIEQAQGVLTAQTSPPLASDPDPHFNV